jgi:nitrogen fixation/metabolism regulation signal transduction histidine kinase
MTDSIRLTRESLGRILKLIPVSRDRFNNASFREVFLDDLSQQVVLIDRLTESLEKYIVSKEWDEGTGKINLLVKEILKNHQMEFTGKHIQVHLSLQEDIPNVTLPDEHLKHVIKVVLQYATSSPSRDDHVKITMKHVEVQEGTVEVESRNRTGYIELDVDFSGYPWQIDPSEDDFGMTLSNKEKVLKLELSFAKNIVEIHGGQLRLLHRSSDSTTTINLRLPIRK